MVYTVTREAWSDEDQRRFQRVKQSELERGMSEELAEEIASRTVDMHRRSIELIDRPQMGA